MKMCGGVEVYLHVFLASSLGGIEWLGSHTGHFAPIHLMQMVSGGKVNILGGHNICRCKQKKSICTCVLFRTVSEIELFHCTLLLLPLGALVIREKFRFTSVS
jgi:hypothetical protein